MCSKHIEGRGQRVTPVEFRGDLWHQKTRVPGLSCGVVCVILRLAVLVEHRLVSCDRQTDGHRTMASTADAQHRAVKTTLCNFFLRECHFYVFFSILLYFKLNFHNFPVQHAFRAPVAGEFLGRRSSTVERPSTWTTTAGTYLRLLQTISENSFIWRPKRLMTLLNLQALYK